jgi:amino acid permease
MPALTQQAGWLVMVVVLVLVSIISAACGKLLLAAMRGMPKNENFQMRVEFPDLLKFYLPRAWYLLSMLVYLGFMVLTLMTYVIQTAQVLDYAFVHSTGYAWGLQLYPDFGPVRGAEKHSSTPFGDSTVISVSFLVLAVVCGPLSHKNLDDNVPLQVLSIVGLTLLAAVWLTILPGMPDFPSQLPVATSSVHNVIGTTLFNFAFVGSLPSWANEKQPEVSVNRSFMFSLGYVVLVYAAVGIVGGMAYDPYYVTDENLFSKLNVSGQLIARLTVFLYPVLQNFTSIPVFSIILRYNFLQLGWMGPRAATCVAFALPWVLSIFFYTGHGFEMVSNWGGLFFSSVVNFTLPVVLFALCGLRRDKLYKMEP